MVARQDGLSEEDFIAAVRKGDSKRIRKGIEFFNDGWVSEGRLPDAELIPSSGPYKLSKLDAGQRLTLVANDRWWGTPAATPTIVERFITLDEQAQALQNREVQIVEPQPGPDVLRQLQSLRGVEVGVFEKYTYEHLDFNFDSSPFRDRMLREAFARCVPRQLIVNTLIGPVSPAAKPLQVRTVAPFQANSAAVVAASGSAGVYARQDIAGARALLREAGKTGLEISIGYQTPNPRRTAAVQLIIDACNKGRFQGRRQGLRGLPRHRDAGQRLRRGPVRLVGVRPGQQLGLQLHLAGEVRRPEQGQQQRLLLQPAGGPSHREAELDGGPGGPEPDHWRDREAALEATWPPSRCSSTRASVRGTRDSRTSSPTPRSRPSPGTWTNGASRRAPYLTSGDRYGRQDGRKTPEFPKGARMPRATGTFTIDSWDPQPYDEGEGATLSRVHITKTFDGDLAGTSTTDIITAIAQVETSAAYAGFERFTGTAHGRKGTFVLHHTATSHAGGSGLSWTILPESGTGELRGIRGGGQIVNEDGAHSFHLDYELD
ncbi:hypothetical protein GCM10018952_35900 [Streptosporangium vulgare]